MANGNSSANAQISVPHLYSRAPFGWSRRNFVTPISHRKLERWSYQAAKQYRRC